MSEALARVVVRVDGSVQGVGFRYWVLRQAGRLGLSGHAANAWDGSVEVEAQGLPEDVHALVALLTERRTPGRPGYVSSHLVEHRSPDSTITGFTIR